MKFFAGFRRIRRRLENPELSGLKVLPADNPVENQLAAANARQSDPLAARPGIESVGLAGQRGKSGY